MKLRQPSLSERCQIQRSNIRQMKQYEKLSIPFTCVKGFFTILAEKEELSMIDLRNVEKTYFSAAGDIHALQKTNLHINAGEIFGIIGLSGAGKSTLIRCINMLEVPTGGQVFVDGQELTAMNNQQLRKARQNIGMIFQHFNLLTSRTVYDNVAFPLEIQGLPQDEIKKRVQPLLELVQLQDRGIIIPVSFPAAKSSVSALPAPWPVTQRCCCAMKRLLPLTRRRRNLSLICSRTSINA